MDFLLLTLSCPTLLWFEIEQNDEVLDHERVIRGDLGLGQERKLFPLKVTSFPKRYGTSLVDSFMPGPERTGLVMTVRVQRSQSLMKAC
jgi:hypothetical protein